MSDKYTPLLVVSLHFETQCDYAKRGRPYLTCSHCMIQKCMYSSIWHSFIMSASQVTVELIWPEARGSQYAGHLQLFREKFALLSSHDESHANKIAAIRLKKDMEQAQAILYQPNLWHSLIMSASHVTVTVLILLPGDGSDPNVLNCLRPHVPYSRSVFGLSSASGCSSWKKMFFASCGCCFIGNNFKTRQSPLQGDTS